MNEPDVTLTDFALAALCFGLAASLLRRSDGDPAVRRPFAALFIALGLAAFLGGAWHGFVSAPAGNRFPGVWTLTMLALGAAASALWMISARLARDPLWGRVLTFIAFAQFVVYAAVVLFRSQSFGVAGLAMLPPVVMLAAILFARYRRTGSGRLLAGLAGLMLVLAANVLQRLHVAFPAIGLSANGLYHILQACAFLLVFLAVPALRRRG
jgi:hypothetical protein